jgi:hypothetical protein
MVIGFTSCASTRIVSDDPYADIYMDEKWIGKGEASVGSLGPPHTAELIAKRGGKVVGRASMRGRFRCKRVLWGMFSYYTGLYWAWYYPESVTINKTHHPDSEKKQISLWDNPRESVWMKPIQSRQP